MKIEAHVKDKNITIDMPEGVAAMYAFATENKYSSGMHAVPKDLALEIATDFFVHILENAPDVVVAASLCTLREVLKEKGIVSGTVDMAVSMCGKVIPVDEIAAEMEAEAKKDR